MAHKKFNLRIVPVIKTAASANKSTPKKFVVIDISVPRRINKYSAAHQLRALHKAGKLVVKKKSTVPKVKVALDPGITTAAEQLIKVYKEGKLSFLDKLIALDKPIPRKEKKLPTYLPVAKSFEWYQVLRSETNKSVNL